MLGRVFDAVFSLSCKVGLINILTLQIRGSTRKGSERRENLPRTHILIVVFKIMENAYNIQFTILSTFQCAVQWH